MTARLFALPWQPIDSAKRDGSGFLAYGRHTTDRPFIVPDSAGSSSRPREDGKHWSIGDQWFAIILWDVWRGTSRWVFAKDGTAVWSEPTHWIELTPPAEGEHQLPFPAELTPELGEVLGQMLWNTGPIAHGFRDAGVAEIPRKAEAEQAFVLHWMVRVALEHGVEWRKHAGVRISEIIVRAKAARTAQSADE